MNTSVHDRYRHGCYGKTLCKIAGPRFVADGGASEIERGYLAEYGGLTGKDGEVAWIGMDEKSFRKRRDYIFRLNNLEEKLVLDEVERHEGSAATTLSKRRLTGTKHL